MKTFAIDPARADATLTVETLDCKTEVVTVEPPLNGLPGITVKAAAVRVAEGEEGWAVAVTSKWADEEATREPYLLYRGLTRGTAEMAAVGFVASRVWTEAR
jgi:hypothetical protein